jgi:hypothetical protein
VIQTAALALLTAASCFALDLRQATIQLRPGATPIEKKAAEMIAQEIEKRTQLRLPVSQQSAPLTIAISRIAGPAEGFTLTTSPASVSIQGNDDRGIIFGAGYFLRQLRMSRQRLEIAESLHVGAIYPRTRHLRNQHHRTDPAPVRRCCRQSPFPAGAD